MAASALQYALMDSVVELPVPLHNQPGCAAAAIANELRKSSGRSFTDLFRAVATSPALGVRTVDATAASGRAAAPPARAPGQPAAQNDSFAAAAAPGDPVLANLASRRSTFSFVARELASLRSVGPTEVQLTLDNHFSAALAFGAALNRAIDTSFPKPSSN